MLETRETEELLPGDFESGEVALHGYGRLAALSCVWFSRWRLLSSVPLPLAPGGGHR